MSDPLEGSFTPTTARNYSHGEYEWLASIIAAWKRGGGGGGCWRGEDMGGGRATDSWSPCMCIQGCSQGRGVGGVASTPLTWAVH